MTKIISLLFFITTVSFCASLSAEHYVLSNQSLSIDELTEYEIKAIYLGRMTQLKSGEILSPCYLVSEKNLIDDFFNGIVKKNHSRYLRYWNKRMFSGEGTPPIEVQNEAQLIAFLLNVDGAICISATRMGSLHDALKIVVVFH